MKRIHQFIAGCLALSGAVLCGCNAPRPLEEFSVENPLDISREDESLVLTRAQLKPTDNRLLPAVADKQGASYIPCQLDDLDGDGAWDELAFVYTFAPSETATLKVKWVKAEDYPHFTPRTNVRYGKMNTPGVTESLTRDSHGKHHLPRGAEGYPYQMDGPAWENDRMGFRHYFDGRNCCDVFGKRVPEMVLDTVGISAEGCPSNTYQVLREWGCDIMSAANSFGLGGLAMQTPDSLVRMGVTYNMTEDVIDSTYYELVTRGPVRSIFRLTYKGWQIKEHKIDLCEEITIRAGKYGYEKRVRTSALPETFRLVTGVITNLNTQPFIEEEYEGKQHAMLTHDKQTVNCSHYFGMGLLIPADQLAGTFHAPDEHADILKTWCALLKPAADGTYRYRAYAAWELGDERFHQREAFRQMVEHDARCTNHPILIHL